MHGLPYLCSRKKMKPIKANGWCQSNDPFCATLYLNQA